jgi:hypothetical protein
MSHESERHLGCLLPVWPFHRAGGGGSSDVQVYEHQHTSWRHTPLPLSLMKQLLWHALRSQPLSVRTFKHVCFVVGDSSKLGAGAGADTGAVQIPAGRNGDQITTALL